MALTPCIIRSVSLKRMPAVNIHKAIKDVLLMNNCLKANIYPRIKRVITPNKTRCRYPITIGLKPKARSLKAGITEPNCNSNFMESAVAEKASIQVAVGGTCCLISSQFFLIRVTSHPHANTCNNAATITSI